MPNYLKEQKKWLPLPRNTLGLTGFDSRLEWYVSTRSVGWWLLNPNGHQIYLATTTMLSLPKRSTVVYWLNSVTR